MFLSLFLLRFSITGLRNETEAVSNTASTLLEHAHIINHTFRVYMLELQRRSDSETSKDSNAKQTNEGYTVCMWPNFWKRTHSCKLILIKYLLAIPVFCTGSQWNLVSYITILLSFLDIDFHWLPVQNGRIVWAS